ncbi:MAG: roadblock/LC7 domain-containing protein [Candidatus Asgardarchaeia archaeon]
MSEESFEGTNREMLEQVLKNLKAKDPDIEGIIIAKNDGLVIASLLSTNEDPLLISALTASLYSMSIQAITKLQRGSMKQLLITGTKGMILVKEINDQASIGAILSSKANIGLAMIELDRAIKKIRNIIESM